MHCYYCMVILDSTMDRKDWKSELFTLLTKRKGVLSTQIKDSVVIAPVIVLPQFQFSVSMPSLRLNKEFRGAPCASKKVAESSAFEKFWTDPDVQEALRAWVASRRVKASHTSSGEHLVCIQCRMCFNTHRLFLRRIGSI